MNKTGRLAGKVALVTGAGSLDGVGIGAAMSIRFAQEGCRVVVVDRDATAAGSTVAAIRKEGGECTPVLADVAVAADCRRAAAEAMAAFERVDILVNNAAISRPGSILDVTDENWDAVMNVNLKGTMLMSRSVIPHIGRGGSIVNISSRSAIRPSRSGVAYCTSKGAIITLGEVMAMQVGSLGIRVNSVVPGGPWTPLARRVMDPGLSEEQVTALREKRRLELPLQLEGSAWDVAAAALFFASDDSRWVTGQAIVVDGGSVLCRPGAQGHDTAHVAFEIATG